MRCGYCKYEWDTRKGKPVECPKCKRYLKGTDDEVVREIDAK